MNIKFKNVIKLIIGEKKIKQFKTDTICEKIMMVSTILTCLEYSTILSIGPLINFQSTANNLAETFETCNYILYYDYSRNGGPDHSSFPSKLKKKKFSFRRHFKKSYFWFLHNNTCFINNFF